MNSAEIVNLLLELFRRRAPPQHIGFLTELGPTQKDKPSPSTPYTIEELRRRVREGFGSDVIVFTIADTNSMEPYIDDNSLVLMHRVPQNMTLRPGMICSYDGNASQWDAFHGKYILHEVVAVDEDHDRVRFKGYNNLVPDGWVDRNAILYNLLGVLHGSQEEEGD